MDDSIKIIAPDNQPNWPTSGLRVNPHNPRLVVEDESFTELLASIQSQGILQPLLITTDGMVLAGHRRLHAAQRLELAQVPVRVIPDGEGVDLELVPLLENLMRSDLTVVEAANYLARFQDRWESTPAEISRMTGIASPTVNNYLKIARAPEQLKQMIGDDRLSLAAALEALRHGPEVVSIVVSHQSDVTKNQVREIAKTRKALPAKGYIEQRQMDISWSLDKLEEIRKRLEPHSDKEFASSVAAQVKLIENHLKDSLVLLTTLANSIVDWSAVISKGTKK